MSKEESHEELQNSEIEALKAIFEDDCTVFKTPLAWGKRGPNSVKLRLGPSQSSQQNNKNVKIDQPKIDLLVKYSEKYPDEIPEISLENAVELSDDLIAKLKNELVQKAEEEIKKADVIVFQLATHVQEFLYKHRKPPVILPNIDASKLSLHDEMVKNKKQLEEQRLNENKIKEDHRNQTLQQKVQQYKDILKAGSRTRRESRLSSSESSTSNDNMANSDSSAEYSRNGLPPVRVECVIHKSTKIVTFKDNRKIYKGRCLGHSNTGFISYIGLDCLTGEPLCIKEYRIQINQLFSKKLLPQIKQKFPNSKLTVEDIINSLEEQLNILVDLNHINLVYYEGSLCFREDNYINVYLLQKFIIAKLGFGGPRQLARGCIRGLAFLHKNQIAHNNLVESSVLIDEKGEVRLADYGFQLITALTEEQGCADYGGGFRRDLNALGTLLKKSAALEYDSNLWDFIDKCLSADSNSTAENLLNHPFLESFENTTRPVDYQIMRPIHHAENDNQNKSRSGPSRLQEEFTSLMKLGEGAFGDVLKVRNNLDGGLYAIKRIKLNDKDNYVSRKMTREVELLSKLNHENVVRYYNSWIEISNTTDTPKEPPPPDSADWSVSYESRTTAKTASPHNDSDSDDDETFTFVRPNRDLSEGSESILFEGSGPVEEESSVPDESIIKKEVQPLNKVKWMYIQMEFCEKSTLRTAIDSGLYKDTERVWRLFREIVEGLSHIHQQGMIHRDLKPVNIFLDSRDQVKIGDFGLATTIFPRNENGAKVSNVKVNDKESVAVPKDSGKSHTGLVGTTLYIAPELNEEACKADYNQKVDVYSLGIILFEMSYHFETGMERVHVLTMIRHKDITMPDNVETVCPKQARIIRLLLNHDQSQRPTTAQILASEDLPPLRLEDRELNEMVRTTLANPKAKAYKYLIARCLDQHVGDSALDIAYHMDDVSTSRTNTTRLLEIVKEAVVKVFKKHGGTEISTPLLTPFSREYDDHDSGVRLMTHSGSVVTLPHDLRLPFARYAALNDIKMLRRYAIDKVYSEKKVFGFHPKQKYQAAFDVISPSSDSLLIDAELIYMIFEIITSFPELEKKNIKIKLNHTIFWKAIFAHCKVPVDKQPQIFDWLDEYSEEKLKKKYLKAYLANITPLYVELLNLLTMENEIGKNTTKNPLCMLKKFGGGGEMGEKIRAANQYLETVVQLAQRYGVEYSMIISFGLRLPGSRCVGLSGLYWQVVYDRDVKKSTRPFVLAGGGRYDNILRDFRKCPPHVTGVHPIASGLSISVDRIIQALAALNITHNPVDIAVCSGDKSNLKDITLVLRSLWQSGVRTAVVESSSLVLEEALEKARELHASHIVLPKENDLYRVRSYDQDNRFQERKIHAAELSNHLHNVVKTRLDVKQEFSAASNIQSAQTNYNASLTHIRFCTSEKITSSQKKRTESAVLRAMEPALQRLAACEKVTILVVDLKKSEMQNLADNINISEDIEYLQQSINDATNAVPRDIRKYYGQICEEIVSILKEQRHIVALCTIANEYAYRILL